jgi:hypothetical protein
MLWTDALALRLIAAYLEAAGHDQDYWPSYLSIFT